MNKPTDGVSVPASLYFIGYSTAASTHVGHVAIQKPIIPACCQAQILWYAILYNGQSSVKGCLRIRFILYCIDYQIKSGMVPVAVYLRGLL